MTGIFVTSLPPRILNLQTGRCTFSPSLEDEIVRLRKLIIDVVKEMEQAFPDAKHCQECGINQTEAWKALEKEAKQ